MEQHTPTARPPRRNQSPRVPPFYPVPDMRGRRDGWSPRKQANFLALLAETGSVSATCRHVGMSRASAYKLRRRPGAESFAAAWDAALGAPVRKVTRPDPGLAANSGLIRIRMQQGRNLDAAQESDDFALLRLIDRFDRMPARRAASRDHFSGGFVSGIS